MTSADFERELRDRMRGYAAQLDRTLGPTPPLEAVLAHERSADRRIPSMNGRGRQLGFALAGVAAVSFVLVVAFMMLGQRPGAGPVASIAPSTIPSVATAQPSIATPSPARVVTHSSPAGMSEAPASTASPSSTPSPSAPPPLTPTAVLIISIVQ
jgi:hypothetical protein